MGSRCVCRAIVWSIFGDLLSVGVDVLVVALWCFAVETYFAPFEVVAVTLVAIPVTFCKALSGSRGATYHFMQSRLDGSGDTVIYHRFFLSLYPDSLSLSAVAIGRSISISAGAGRRPYYRDHDY